MPSPGEEVQQVFREIERLQNSGYVLKAGETWITAAKNSMRGVSIASRVGGLLNRVTGISSDLVRQMKADIIIAGIGLEGENLIQRAATEHRLDLNPFPTWAEPIIGAAIRGGSEAIGAPFFDLLIKEPLGLDLSAIPGEQGSEAVRALQRLFGFGIMLDFGTSELHDVLKMSMGDNAPTGLLEAVKNIPQSVGVNWAVGFLLSQFVWTAYMPPLVERANRQTRPLRLSPGELFTAEQRELMSRGEVDEELARLGYRDPDMDRMRQIAQTRLSVSDLQQAYLLELRDESFVNTYLKRQGMSETDADLATQLYLANAETAGGDQLRAVAQRGFLEGHLTEGQYYEILTTVHVPRVSANLEVEAAKLSKTWQVKQLGIAQIKALHDRNIINDAQAQARIIAQGYTDEQALELIASWKPAIVAAHPGLTESMVLAYLLSGVISPEQAYDRLIGMDIIPGDAAFLVAHPSAAQVTKPHGPAESLIISAFLDGILDVVETEQRLAATGLDAQAVNLAIREATFRQVRGKTPTAPHRDLSDAQILAAFRLGLANSAWTTRRLIALGHTPDDALLIVAIEETQQSADGSPPADWTVLQ